MSDRISYRREAAREQRCVDRAILSPRQRDSYRAWQACPQAWSGEAFQTYLDASNDLARFDAESVA